MHDRLKHGQHSNKSALEQFLGEPLRVHCRNLPLATISTSVLDIRSAGWKALEGDLLYPLLLLKENAVASNISLMVKYCQEANVLHAPHAKTPMSPQLVWRLLEAGAWGTSIASVDQARVMRRFGVSRLLMANQLIEEQGLRWIAQEIQRDPEFDFWCLVDSVHGVELMDAALAGTPSAVKIKVLIEVGVMNGRAGCRNESEIIAVAQAIKRTSNLELSGIELYEAMAAKGATTEQKLIAVDTALAALRHSMCILVERGLIRTSAEVIVTAGGSLYFDRVVEAMRLPLADIRDVKVVLRGGCFLTHEAGENDCLSPLSGRSSMPCTLHQGLELWGLVLSRPEPGLAILNFGKRDAPFDKGLPVSFAEKRRGCPVEKVGEKLQILSLNDQHARVSIPPDHELSPGDLVGFHISHPCTAFDKWQLVPVVDESYAVIDGIVTFF